MMHERHIIHAHAWAMRAASVYNGKVYVYAALAALSFE